MTASLCAVPTHAETNEVLMPKGMWKDPATGLIWDRCSLGQTWNGQTCTGSAAQYSWDAVVSAIRQHNRGGYADWQLPNVAQLRTLIQCSKGFDVNRSSTVKSNSFEGLGDFKFAQCAIGSDKPTLNSQTFPNTPSNSYWSASPYVINKFDYGLIWGVEFGDVDLMRVLKDVRTESLYVRVVRTSNSLGSEVLQKIFNAPFVLENQQNKVIEEERARRQAINSQQRTREQAAYQQRVADFRRSIRAGDDTSQGLVTEVRGDLIKVQMNRRSCTSSTYSGICVNWTNTPVEKWVKRSEVLPLR